MAKSPMDFVQEAKAQIKEVSVNDVQAGRSEDTVMLDVRDPNEFDKGRITGAVHASRGMLEFVVDKVVADKDAHVVVYCGTGGRSALAAHVMQQMGYTNVASMAGGITAWKDHNLPVEA